MPLARRSLLPWARLAALEALLLASGDVNHDEVYWLRHRIAGTREQLGR